MRARIKKIIIDYQTNKKQTIGLKIHYQLSNDKLKQDIYTEPIDELILKLNKIY